MNSIHILLCCAVALGCSLAAGEETPAPLPLLKDPKTTPKSEAPLRQAHSPCTFDVDATWLKPLGHYRVEQLRFEVPEPIDCDGAVIRSISAMGNSSTKNLQFKVAFRPGRDRRATISFAVLDDKQQIVGRGEVGDNLDEGEDSFLTGTLKIANAEFDRLFVSGAQPSLRVTLRIEGN